MVNVDEFSRIGKFFMDRDGTTPEAAKRLLCAYPVALICGPEVAESASLQAAVLTAANIASRCFPGAVTLYLPGAEPITLKVPWRRTEGDFAAAVTSISGAQVKTGTPNSPSLQLVFGGRTDCTRGLQVTFDGWIGAVAPIGTPRLPEHDYCVLAGVLAGALAVSEGFLSLAGVQIEATHRPIAISLWRPDVDYREPEALGLPIEYLPAEFWMLGLGHLGQAYLWSIALLPFNDNSMVRILLNDFDKVVPANFDTGLLTFSDDVGRLKTKVCEDWLSQIGFNPTRCDRRFDELTHPQKDEPLLALCGFDGRGPRHLLDTAGFTQVVECGLGGRSTNFDAMLIHNLPSSTLTASAVWPQGETGTAEDIDPLMNNQFYKQIADELGCGHAELAGISVAVPFVGAIAGTLVIAETVRMFHAGARYEGIDLRLERPSAIRARLASGGYAGKFQPRLAFVSAHPI